MMNVKPILFSGDMIRAILDGRKTQTRRVIKPQPMTDTPELWEMPSGDFLTDSNDYCVKCPYGQPGDLLWVRETWKAGGLLAFHKPSETKGCGRFTYKADAEQLKRDELIPWHPSIHMPRSASRITLKITEVRVQRIQEITTEDVLAESVRIPTDENGHGLIQLTGKYPASRYLPKGFMRTVNDEQLIRAYWASLWDSINDKSGFGWNTNPWVWCLSFDVIRENVDAVLSKAA